MDRINRNTKLPYHEQLYEILHDKMARREWKPGDMIPTEAELIAKYGVSRSTVRQVLDRLVARGRIFRERGRGSFVAHPTLEQALVRVVSFTEDMRQRGFEPSTKVIRSTLVPAPSDIAKSLGVQPGDELALLERLRGADGEPMSIEEAYLVHRYCPGVLEGDYTVRPLREALEQEYGIRIVRARQIIHAVSATKEQAQLLAVPVRSPLLFIERVSISQNDAPVEFLRISYRGDRYSLYGELIG